MLAILCDARELLAIGEAFFGARRLATFRAALRGSRSAPSARRKGLTQQGMFKRSRSSGAGASRIASRLTEADVNLDPGCPIPVPFGEHWLTSKKGPPRRVGGLDSFRSECIIAPNIRAVRLSRRLDRGIIRRRQSQGPAVRYAYRLTAAGKDLYGALVVMMACGDRRLSPGRSPAQLTHVTCGTVCTATVIGDKPLKPAAASNTRYRPDWDPCDYAADSSEGRVNPMAARCSKCHSATARG
jgi:DNA-binding HxlR family transcriptional regulator